MPATTWRLTGLTLPDGQDLRITGVQLWAGDTDVTAQATVSSSFAPSEGALSALTDGDAGSACVWAAQQVRLPGFYIEWTFAEAVEITRIFLGAAVYAGVLTGGASVINAVGVVDEGVMLGAVSWRAKKALEHGAVGFWSLTDSGSVQTDEVAGARNATRTGGAVVAAQLAVDGGYAFDPQTTGLIRIPSAAGVDAAGFSVCIDFQFTTAENLVIAEHGNDNNGWSIQSGGAISNTQFGIPVGHLIAPVGGASTSLWFTDVPVNDGEPHRFIMTVDANGTTVFYLDGRVATRRGNVSGTRVPVYNTSYIDIGSRNGTYGLPAGSRIANFALFNRVLSTHEARLLSNSVGWPVQTIPQTATLAVAQEHWLGQGESATQSPQVMALDMEYGGPGTIHGTVEQKLTGDTTLPLKRRVRLHRSRDGLLVRETWSDAQGNYRFDGLSTRYEYDVIAWDHEGQFRSTIANNLKPEVLS